MRSLVKGMARKKLPVRLRNLENKEPVEGIQEENVCIEDILGLSINLDDSYEDEDNIVDYCE